MQRTQELSRRIISTAGLTASALSLLLFASGCGSSESEQITQPQNTVTRPAVTQTSRPAATSPDQPQLPVVSSAPKTGDLSQPVLADQARELLLTSSPVPASRPILSDDSPLFGDLQAAAETEVPAAESAEEARRLRARMQTAFAELCEAHQQGDPEAWDTAWEAVQSAISDAGRHAAAPLATGLASPKESSRELASMLLAQLGMLAEPALAELVAALDDPSIFIRANVASTLSHFPGQSERLVPVLTDLLHASDESVRITAAVSLGNVGEPATRAIPALLQLVQQEDGELQSAAVRTLSGFGAEAAPSLPSIEQARDDATGTAKSLLDDAITEIRAAAAATDQPAGETSSGS